MSKYSRQREMILDALTGNRCHPTADWVYNHLKPDNPALSMGTVYRNLNFLVERGLVRKLSVPGEADRFDGQADTHMHFRCRQCGSLIDLKGEAAEEILDFARRFRDLTGLEMDPAGLLLEGRCEACSGDSPGHCS